MERTLHVIGYSYLGGDVGVASHVFAGMNNSALSTFVSYLCDRFEKNAQMKAHVRHFLNGFDILRGNRNILMHAVPSITHDRKYIGQFQKSDRKGMSLSFDAPFDKLNEVLADLNIFLGYGRTISLVLRFQKNEDGKRHMGGPTKSEAGVGALDDIKPTLPNKLAPSNPN